MLKFNLNNVIKYIQETIVNINTRNEKLYIEKLKENFDIQKQTIYIHKKTGNKCKEITNDISNYNVVKDDVYTPKYIYIENPIHNTCTQIPKYLFNNNSNLQIDDAKINLNIGLKTVLDDIYIYINDKKKQIEQSDMYYKYKNKEIKNIYTRRIICNDIDNCNKCTSKYKLKEALKKIIKYIIIDNNIHLKDLINDINNNNIQLSHNHDSLNIEFNLKKYNDNGNKIDYWLKT
jgi:hypothetical protein